MKSLLFVGVIVLSVLPGINEAATFFESNRLLRRLMYQQHTPQQQTPQQQIPQTVACTKNEDCGSNEWCRLTGLDTLIKLIKECVPYAAEGESCGGYTMPQYYEQCAPGKTCADLHPCIFDVPGICATPCESGYGFNSNGECTQKCGTIKGLTCDIGYKCEYGFCCDPANGGRDCGGLCQQIPKPTTTSTTTTTMSNSPGCGNIPNCKSYQTDSCNMCSCPNPVNNPTLAMCTLMACPDIIIYSIPECTRCIDGYTLLNKRCQKRKGGQIWM